MTTYEYPLDVDIQRVIRAERRDVDTGHMSPGTHRLGRPDDARPSAAAHVEDALALSQRRARQQTVENRPQRRLEKRVILQPGLCHRVPVHVTAPLWFGQS